MNRHDFDLNLLRVLDALLIEGSVTAAAKRLHLSQPAMSNALNRLRQQLDDPLIVRVGNRMVPTPRALSLAEPVSTSLRLIQQSLASPAPFNPATAQAQVRIMATDYVSAVLLPLVWQRLRKVAPGISLAMIFPAESGSSDALSEGKAELAFVGPSAELQDSLKQQKLFDERFVCIARRKHPALRKGLTLDAYCAADHVLASPKGGGFISPLDQTLAALGRSRRVSLSVAQFLLGPRIVAESDMLMTLGEHLARSVAPQYGLTIHPLPFTAPSFRVMQAWHVRLDRDPLQRWLRGQILECAKTLQQAARSG